MTADPLGDLATRARQGDARAATELLQTIAPRASRIVHSLSGPTSAHEDLVQEVLVAFLRALSRFEGRSSVDTFLYGICLRVVRRHRRGIARLLRALEGFFLSPVEPRSPRTAYGAMRSGEQAKAIHDLLDRLSAKRREVLVLCEMEGKSAAEAAAILGIPEATVYTRLHHARKAFRKLAEKAPEVLEDDGG